MSLLGRTWKYINEGNVHIVLHIVNTDYVFRLIKEEGQNTTDLEVIRNSVNFVNSVMIPIIFGNYDYQEEVITISLKEIAELSQKLKKIRPKYRQIKSNISQYALKAPNLTVIDHEGDSYCIEIKPKEGFMSKTFSKYSKCYYCLKQHIKLSEKQIKSISNYCPLDLFSGNKLKMKSALQSLINSPQNNFKVFKNGTVIYNEESNIENFKELISEIPFIDSVNDLLDLVTEILLSDGNNDIVLNKSTDVINLKDTTYCIQENNLDTNSILYKLQNIQKLSESFEYHCIHTTDAFEYVSSILTQLNDQNINLANENDRETFLSSIDPSYSALISAIAKDCSIMIAFSFQSHANFPLITIGDEKISYRISITDLEPKSIKTLAKRNKTEKKLVEIYETVFKPQVERHRVKFLDCWCISKPVQKIINLFSFRIQPHSETRAKQLEAWQELISEYLKSTKQSTVDIRESQNSPLFNNAAIDRKLSPDAILTILEDMAKTGRAAPIDKSKNVWEVYWHSLDEWGNMLYNWASSNGLNNTVCTLFELREGDNTVGEEFHGLDMNILIKALTALSTKGKCELIEFDDNQGVKFF